MKIVHPNPIHHPHPLIRHPFTIRLNRVFHPSIKTDIPGDRVIHWILPSLSLIVVDCIDGSTRIKDRYNNYTTVCRELMQREGHIQLEKVERGQVQEADILARTSSQREWGVGRWMYSANFV